MHVGDPTAAVTTADAPAVAERLYVMDGLRGVAIAMVVLAHSFVVQYRPTMTLGPFTLGLDWFIYGGHLGVELFFYISGFVLFVPYARARLHGKKLPGSRHFADRRFIKIVPSYYLAIVAQCAYFTLPAEMEADRPRELVSHAFFFHSYEGNAFFGINGALWSIAPEVQFYLVFPIVAFAMLRKPIATVAVLIAIGNAYRLWLHVGDRHRDFFWISQLPGQIDIFGIGMISAYGYVRFAHRAVEANVRTAGTAVAVGASACGLWLLSDFARVSLDGVDFAHRAWQNDHRTLVELTIAAVALGSLFAHAWWKAIFSLPPLLWLSTISYNLYLWHLAVLTQCTKTGFPCAGRLAPWHTVDRWDRQFFFSYLCVSIGIAWAITYGFERPLLRMGTGGAYRRFIAPQLARVRSLARKRAA